LFGRSDVVDEAEKDHGAEMCWVEAADFRPLERTDGGDSVAGRRDEQALRESVPDVARVMRRQEFEWGRGRNRRNVDVPNLWPD